MIEITSSTKVVGLFAWPIGHSLSPQMQSAAFAEKNMNWIYLPFPVHPDRVGEAVKGVRALGMAGVNVTIPHKEAVMPFLDEISTDARLIGAVNTIKVENDRLIGYNTDTYGFLTTIEEEGNFSISGKRVAICGSGGVARAIGVVCAQQKAADIVLSDVIIDKASNLCGMLKKEFPDIQIRAFHPDDTDFKDVVANAEMIINATPLGMKIDDPSPAPIDCLSKGTFIFDAVYNPIETDFMKAAKKRGCNGLGGLYMLAYQGAKSFEIWSGVKPNVQLMIDVLKRNLEK